MKSQFPIVQRKIDIIKRHQTHIRRNSTYKLVHLTTSTGCSSARTNDDAIKTRACKFQVYFMKGSEKDYCLYLWSRVCPLGDQRPKRKILDGDLWGHRSNPTNKKRKKSHLRANRDAISPSFESSLWPLVDQKEDSNEGRSRDENYGKLFLNCVFDKGRLKAFVLWFLEKYGQKTTIELLERLKRVGFGYATKAGISLGIDDLRIPARKIDLLIDAQANIDEGSIQYRRGEITGIEKFQRLIDTWHQTSENLKQEVIRHFEATDVLNPVYMMAFSGARGNISQVRQLVGMRGLMADPQGQILDFPIRSNFREGLTLTEYLISSYGARKGIVDTALRTANAGYLTRRLVDVAQHVVVCEFDCQTNRGILILDMKEGNKTIYSFQNRLLGRVLAKDIFEKQRKVASKNQEVSSELALAIAKITKKALVRSPLTCETKKLVCQLCYGWSLSTNSLVSIGEAVGIIAAQSIGEPGTQLTMRTFHTGGVFSGSLSDQIIAQNDGIIEYSAPIPGICVRTPGGQIAFLTKAEGCLIFKPESEEQSPSSRLSVLPDSFDRVFPLVDQRPKGRLETKGLPGNLKFREQNLSKDSNAKSSLDVSKENPQNQVASSVEIPIKVWNIPPYTILFARNRQKVFKKQIIAQLSSFSLAGEVQKTQKSDAEQTIYAEFEGQIHNSNIDVIEKFNEYNDLVFEAWAWGYLWILAGKIYQYPMQSHMFARSKDFVGKNSILNRIQWVSADEFFLTPNFKSSSELAKSKIPSHLAQRKFTRSHNSRALELGKTLNFLQISMANKKTDQPPIFQKKANAAKSHSSFNRCGNKNHFFKKSFVLHSRNSRGFLNQTNSNVSNFIRLDTKFHDVQQAPFFDGRLEKTTKSTFSLGVWPSTESLKFKARESRFKVASIKIHSNRLIRAKFFDQRFDLYYWKIISSLNNEAHESLPFDRKIARLNFHYPFHKLSIRRLIARFRKKNHVLNMKRHDSLKETRDSYSRKTENVPHSTKKATNSLRKHNRMTRIHFLWPANPQRKGNRAHLKNKKYDSSKLLSNFNFRLPTKNQNEICNPPNADKRSTHVKNWKSLKFVYARIDRKTIKTQRSHNSGLKLVDLEKNSILLRDDSNESRSDLPYAAEKKTSKSTISDLENRFSTKRLWRAADDRIDRQKIKAKNIFLFHTDSQKSSDKEKFLLNEPNSTRVVRRHRDHGKNGINLAIAPERTKNMPQSMKKTFSVFFKKPLLLLNLKNLRYLRLGYHFSHDFRNRTSLRHMYAPKERWDCGLESSLWSTKGQRSRPKGAILDFASKISERERIHDSFNVRSKNTKTRALNKFYRNSTNSSSAGALSLLKFRSRNPNGNIGETIHLRKSPRWIPSNFRCYASNERKDEFFNEFSLKISTDSTKSTESQLKFKQNTHDWTPMSNFFLRWFPNRHQTLHNGVFIFSGIRNLSPSGFEAKNRPMFSSARKKSLRQTQTFRLNCHQFKRKAKNLTHSRSSAFSFRRVMNRAFLDTKFRLKELSELKNFRFRIGDKNSFPDWHTPSELFVHPVSNDEKNKAKKNVRAEFSIEKKTRLLRDLGSCEQNLRSQFARKKPQHIKNKSHRIEKTAIASQIFPQKTQTPRKSRKISFYSLRRFSQSKKIPFRVKRKQHARIYSIEMIRSDFSRNHDKKNVLKALLSSEGFENTHFGLNPIYPSLRAMNFYEKNTYCPLTSKIKTTRRISTTKNFKNQPRWQNKKSKSLIPHKKIDTGVKNFRGKRKSSTFLKTNSNKQSNFMCFGPRSKLSVSWNELFWIPQEDYQITVWPLRPDFGHSMREVIDESIEIKTPLINSNHFMTAGDKPLFYLNNRQGLKKPFYSKLEGFAKIGITSVDSKFAFESNREFDSHRVSTLGDETLPETRNDSSQKFRRIDAGLWPLAFGRPKGKLDQRIALKRNLRFCGAKSQEDSTEGKTRSIDSHAFFDFSRKTLAVSNRLKSNGAKKKRMRSAKRLHRNLKSNLINFLKTKWQTHSNRQFQNESFSHFCDHEKHYDISSLFALSDSDALRHRYITQRSFCLKFLSKYDSPLDKYFANVPITRQFADRNNSFSHFVFRNLDMFSDAPIEDVNGVSKQREKFSNVSLDAQHEKNAISLESSIRPSAFGLRPLAFGLWPLVDQRIALKRNLRFCGAKSQEDSTEGKTRPKDCRLYWDFDRKISERLDRTRNNVHLMAKNKIHISVQLGWVYYSFDRTINNDLTKLNQKIVDFGNFFVDDLLFTNHRVYVKNINHLITSNDSTKIFNRFQTLHNRPIDSQFKNSIAKKEHIFALSVDSRTDEFRAYSFARNRDFSCRTKPENNGNFGRFYKIRSFVSNSKSRYGDSILKRREKISVALLIRPMKHKILPNLNFYKIKIHRANQKLLESNFSLLIHKSFHSKNFNKQKRDQKFISAFPGVDIRISSGLKLPSFRSGNPKLHSNPRTTKKDTARHMGSKFRKKNQFRDSFAAKSAKSKTSNQSLIVPDLNSLPSSEKTITPLKFSHLECGLSASILQENRNVQKAKIAPFGTSGRLNQRFRLKRNPFGIFSNKQTRFSNLLFRKTTVRHCFEQSYLSLSPINFLPLNLEFSIPSSFHYSFKNPLLHFNSSRNLRLAEQKAPSSRSNSYILNDLLSKSERKIAFENDDLSTTEKLYDSSHSLTKERRTLLSEPKVQTKRMAPFGLNQRFRLKRNLSLLQESQDVQKAQHDFEFCSQNESKPNDRIKNHRGLMNIESSQTKTNRQIGRELFIDSLASSSFLPCLNFWLSAKMAYLANQRLFAPYFMNREFDRNPSLLESFSNFPISTNRIGSFRSNRVSSNERFATTSFLSPLCGEMVFRSSNNWSAEPNKNRCLILTEADLFSVYLPDMSEQKEPDVMKNISITNHLRNSKEITKSSLQNNLILQNEPRGTAGQNRFKNKFSSLYQNFLRLEQTRIDRATTQQNASNFTDDGKINPTPEHSLTENILVRYNKKLYKIKQLRIGTIRSHRKLRVGSLLVYGDDISIASAIDRAGQIIHMNCSKVTFRRAQPIFVSPKGILHANNRDFVSQNAAVITLPFQTLKTGDIVQGIPKVEQYFEARTTKRGRLYRDSLPNLLHALFERYRALLPLEKAVRRSFLKIQQIIVDGVQRVYRSQGVSISDKHLEVIVRQMTSKVQIVHGGQTGFFPGELVDLEFVEHVNRLLLRKIYYEPVVLGITRASLESESFLSAASFQQTTKVLSKAAVYRKKDFLKGLKENIIVGNLIPGGTGYLVYLKEFFDMRSTNY